MKLGIFQKKVFAFILLIACINLFMGCQHYFRPVVVNAPTIETKQSSLKKLSEQNRYFILRKGFNSYAMTNIIIDQTKMTMTANVAKVPPEHSLYLIEKPKYTYSPSRKQDIVFTEVHLFTVDTSQVEYSTIYSFSLSDIKKIETIEFDKQKTNSSKVWGAVGITLGAIAVVGIIAALSYSAPAPPPPSSEISSCPFISSYVGEGYMLQGEIYSAALYPSLQKDDYLPLKIEPVNGEYRLKISNELKEIQHTDFADLMVVEHNNNVNMMIDPEGKIYSVSLPQSPVSAMLNNNVDVIDRIRFKDNSSCLFKDDNGSRPTEDLLITFKNDQKANQGKLIISTKTSPWLNYVYGEFTRGFGKYYNNWVKKEEKRPGSELEKWAEEQHIPLTISVKANTGWKEIQKISSIGPLLTRDIVMPVELAGEEMVEIKISGGYLFWELDYAAIDYSPNADFRVQTIKPYEAINEHGANVLPELLNADKKYLDQPNIGDSTILKYESIEKKEGMSQTVFLHSSGYYKHIRNYSGTPKVAFLKSFNQPGALSAFSRQKYAETWNQIATAKN